MAIPSQTEMFKVVLQIMADKQQLSRRQCKAEVRERLNLTEADVEEKTSSGVRVYESRVGWAMSWLSDATYITRINRGVYQITDAGRQVNALNLSPTELGVKVRQERSEHMENLESDPPAADSQIDSIEEVEQNPQERLDAAVKELHDQLANDLLKAIMEPEGRDGDTFFEKIVTDLLEKIGYGEGRVTQASNDGGIDGIIKTDPLGFDPILIQAKRYSLDNKVGRPEIQRFAGALGSVSRGVFITTSSFQKTAIDWARNYPHATLVLIDGKQLVNLMIQYGLGVSTDRVIKIQHLDTDYFNS